MTGPARGKGKKMVKGWLRARGWSKAKAEGRLRVEGKDYEVLDGDVLEIRFNV